MSPGVNYKGPSCRELCDMDTVEEGICAGYAIYYFPAVNNSTTKQPAVNWCYLYNYVKTKEEQKYEHSTLYILDPLPVPDANGTIHNDKAYFKEHQLKLEVKR